MPLGWDVKNGKIWYFLKEKDKFIPTTFKDVDMEDEGIKLIVGQPVKAPKEVSERYALTFDPKIWTLKQAQRWVDDNNMHFFEGKDGKKSDPKKDGTPIDEGGEDPKKDTPPPANPPEPKKDPEPQANPANLNEDTTEQEVQISGELESLSEGVEIDEANGIIRGVCVIRPVSKNGRKYTEQCLREAIPFYEGARSYADHEFLKSKGIESQPRSVKDLCGQLINVREGTDSRGFLIRGDYKTIGKHGKHLMEIAKKAPGIIGLSHSAQGFIKMLEGEKTVVRIGRVDSVDVVTTPGTTNSLFESAKDGGSSGEPPKDPKPTQTKESQVDKNQETVKLSEIDSAFLQKHFPNLVKELRHDILEENNQYKKEIDELKLKESVREREELIEKSIAEAGLRSAHVTEVFKKTLREAKTDLEVKQLVLDRKNMVLRESGKPKSKEQVPIPEGDIDLTGNSGQVSDEELMESISKSLK